MGKIKYVSILIIAFLLLSCSDSSELLKESCAQNNSCYGEWLSFRGDAEGSGSSTIQLNWITAPKVSGEFNLEINKPMDPRRFMVDRTNSGINGYLANIGSGVKYITTSGQEKWFTSNLGTGEIIDIADLDGDGRRELIFSAVQRFNLNTNSSSGAGVLWMLDIQTGEVLWRHNFEGIQFGLNRYRVSIIDLPDTSAKTILVPQTYDYSLIRFDFDRGVRNGYIKWKSDKFTYDSPDKPSIFYSMKGSARVVVDALGVLYLIDFLTGKVKDSLSYCSGVTFGGGLNYYQDVVGRGYAVVSSSSEYGKSIASVKLDIDNLELLWKNCIEEGLGSNLMSFRPFPELIGIDNNNSIKYTAATEGFYKDIVDSQQLRLREATTGHVWSEINVKGQLRDVVTDAVGQKIFVIVGGRDTEFWKLDKSAQLHKIGSVSGFKWERPFLSAPGVGVSSYYGFGIVVDYDAKRSKLIDLRNGSLVTIDLPNEIANIIAGGFEGVYASTGKEVVLIQPNGVVKPVLSYDPAIFSVPLVADIDGDGKNRIIVSYGTGKAKLILRSGLFEIETIWPNILTEEKESIYAPSIGAVRPDWSRDLIGFFREAGDLYLGAYSNTGQLRWSWPVPAGVWESTFINTNLNAADKSGIIFYRNSRMTGALNQRTGVPLWSKDYLGECQRQISAFDWNSDGVIDLGFQAGARTLVLDGRDGSTLFDQIASGSYGAYVSIMANRRDVNRQFIFHNSGGFSVVDAEKGMIVDDQIYLRKTESLPPVVGRYGENNRTYTINGAGELRFFDGVSHSFGFNLGKNIVAMTGAFVDGDQFTDLLISTFDGELIAISGKILAPIWQKKFDAIPGPAVASVINGKPAILIVTSDGILRVLSK